MIGEWKLAQLHRDLQAPARAFLRWLDAEGLRPTVYDVYRSPEEQERRKAKGDSRAGAWQSPHQYRAAFDYVVIQGEHSEEQYWAQSQAAALGWQTISWDPAHAEYARWREVLAKRR